MIYSVPCRAPALKSLPACWPRLAMSATDSRAMPKIYNGGTAPVTMRSGKYRHCHRRWACDKHLRHAIHLFAEQSLTRCAWAQIYYEHHRKRDRSHSDALRRLGHRWLKIIHKMWIERTPYDPELHPRNQLQHGSWIFQLKACE